jgi:hypothetical protein
MSLQKLNQNIESLQYPVELKHAEAYEWGITGGWQPR